MSCLVSVIVPIYNSERFLSKSLDCIVNQTLRDIEIICVDDGSTDGSLAILNEYAAKDNRIKIITQKNKNAGAARNAGLGIATGKYLSFLDSDDLFELAMLETAYKEAEAQSAEIVIYNSDIFDNKSGRKLPSNWLVNVKALPQHGVFGSEEIIDRIFTSFHPVVWNRLYNAKFVKSNELLFQEIERANDALFSTISLILARRVRWIDNTLLHYRVGSSTQITSSGYIGKKDYFPILTVMNAILDKIEIMDNFDLMLNDFVKFSTTKLLPVFKDINQKNYFNVFYLLKEKWLTRLPNEVFKEQIFTNSSEYLQMESIKANDAVEHIFVLLNLRNKVAIDSDFFIHKRWFFSKNDIHGDVVLYGAGTIGTDFYYQFTDSKRINLVAWVDREFARYRQNGYNVESPGSITKIAFDWIIIAVLDKKTAHQIKEYLILMGIEKLKIISPFYNE